MENKKEKKMRLDKYLSQMQTGTRSQVKTLIRKKQVTVNNETVTRPEMQIVPGSDCVSVQGTEITYIPMEYYMLNKPQGVVSASRDSRERTVLDLLEKKRRGDLFPVGRLDKDTVGLLLITNDGEMAHRLLSPKRHVDKVYQAIIKGKVTREDVMLFEDGVDIGDEKPCLPAELTVSESGDISRVTVKIQEGRYHQIKRMFQTAGKEVIYLKRLSMGSLQLDETLKEGEYRSLTSEEIERLKSI
ncbi:MAG: pseudouridine synthase [Ruminococcus sp.]